MLAGIMALAAQQQACAGLRITTIFVGGNPPPDSAIAGGGSFQAIVETAARKWEKVFSNERGDWHLTVEYGWTNALSIGYTYGFERLLAQGGKPVRSTRARIMFNNTATPSGAFPWYADPTPNNNSEYKTYSTYRGELIDQDYQPSGKFINIGRVFSDAKGAAAGRIDLLTLAMHEIGHALGLDLDYDGYQRQRNGSFLAVTPPRPFSDCFVSLSLAGADHVEVNESSALMVPEPKAGWRVFPSAVDALALGQLSSFDHPLLGPIPGLPGSDDDDDDDQGCNGGDHGNRDGNGHGNR